MLTSLKFNNCFAFNNSIEMNLRADMRTKKFASNVINISEKLNVLKSAVIYGPNNTGKTTLINSIKAIKGTLENKDIRLLANIFTENHICDAGISFVYEEKEYSYEFKFDYREHLYLYEKMAEILRDQHGNETEKLIFVKDTISNHYECPEDENLEKILNITSNNNILIYTVQIEKFNILQKIKEILLSVANSLVIIDMNRVPNDKTIEMLKNKDKETEKIVNFIKNADIYLDDYRYEENLNFEIDGKTFEGLINIGVDKNGNKHFYDINKIRTTSNSHISTSKSSNTDFIDYSIPLTDSSVNNQYMQNNGNNTQGLENSSSFSLPKNNSSWSKYLKEYWDLMPNSTKTFGLPTSEELQAFDNEQNRKAYKSLHKLEDIADMTEDDIRNEKGVNYKHKKDKGTKNERKFFENAKTSEIINKDIKESIDVTTYERQSNAETLENLYFPNY